MPSKHASVPGTLAVQRDGQGDPVRVMHSAAKPECPKCKSSEHVVRLWHGAVKMWVCAKCFKIPSTEAKPATLLQRVLHRLPEPDTLDLGDVLPNRKMRRRRK